MRSVRKFRGVAWAGIVALAGLAAVAPRVEGQEQPLRWKFNVGDKLNYQMTQDMTMVAAGQAFGEVTTMMKQQMDMIWDVQGVNDEGEAVIRQKFDRVRMKMTAPTMPGGGFEYDSKAEEAPTGIAAMIAPIYKSMTEGEFEITMTARGEVKDVKIPNDVMETLKRTPGADRIGGMATEEGFKKMISQGALVLPENPPKPGETWSTKIDMDIPNVGKQIVQTTYKYEGTKEIDGKRFAVIRPELKMEFENKPPDAAPAGKPDDKAPQQPQAPAGMQMKIGEQSSSGEVLFNVGDGRLHSTELAQKVTIGAIVAGQTIQQKIDQKISVTVTPAGEGAEAETATKSEAEPADGAEKSEAKGEAAK